MNYATRWFKAHAAELQATPAATGGMGSSSGGHLRDVQRHAAATTRATPPCHWPRRRTDAALAYLVLVWPILDPYGRFIFAQETAATTSSPRRGLLPPWDASGRAARRRILERGEPVELPPALIVQGTTDANVTPALQERFAARLPRRGRAAEVELFPDQPHLFTARARARRPTARTR